MSGLFGRIISKTASAVEEVVDYFDIWHFGEITCLDIDRILTPVNICGDLLEKAS